MLKTSSSNKRSAAEDLERPATFEAEGTNGMEHDAGEFLLRCAR
jgi:hypothetical protein